MKLQKESLAGCAGVELGTNRPLKLPSNITANYRKYDSYCHKRAIKVPWPTKEQLTLFQIERPSNLSSNRSCFTELA